MDAYSGGFGRCTVEYRETPLLDQCLDYGPQSASLSLLETLLGNAESFIENDMKARRNQCHYLPFFCCISNISLAETGVKVFKKNVHRLT